MSEASTPSKFAPVLICYVMYPCKHLYFRRLAQNIFFFFKDEEAFVIIWNLKLQQYTFGYFIQVLYFLCKGLY